MFYNDFTAAKAAKLVSVEMDKDTIIHRRKRWDATTGKAVADDVTTKTVAELEAQKASLLARVAEIDAILVEAAK